MSEIVRREPTVKGRLWLPILGAILGVILLLWGSVGGGFGKTEESARSDSAEARDVSAFAAELEERIEEICSQVSGAGQVRAVVTLAGGYRAVYAADSRGGENSYQSELVLTGSGSDESAILVGYENPEIAGIGIVCTGGDDPLVRSSLLRLVSAAFDVPSHKIYVASA